MKELYRKIEGLLIGFGLGILVFVGTAAVLVGLDSDDRPMPQDNQGRSLIKINELLYNSIQGKGTNILNTGTLVSNTPTNQIPVVTSGTNQISFSFNAASLCNNITNDGVVGEVAWCSTNDVFTVAGGSGLLQSICLRSPTNQDLIIFGFSKVITAPTVGSTWQPGLSDQLYLVGFWDTTNTMWRAWQQIGTNWVKQLDRLGVPMLNGDSSMHMMFVATHLDTKSNYTGNASYITTGFVNEK